MVQGRGVAWGGGGDFERVWGDGEEVRPSISSLGGEGQGEEEPQSRAGQRKVTSTRPRLPSLYGRHLVTCGRRDKAVRLGR